MSQDTNGWHESKMYVMAELQDLKDAQLRHEGDTKEILATLGELKSELSSFKQHQKWELRILSAAWGLVVMGINAIIGRHGS